MKNLETTSRVPHESSRHKLELRHVDKLRMLLSLPLHTPKWRAPPTPPLTWFNYLNLIYMRQILYIYTDFQVSERLHGGPEFSGNYLIDYVIIT